MISPERIGHVVLKVRNLERSEQFYTEVLGLKVVDRYQDRMVFFSWGENHHDLAIVAVGDDADGPQKKQVGLFHVAMRLRSFDELREAYRFLKQRGVEVSGTTDHGASRSIYFADPDGNQLEVYADTLPSEWENGVRPHIAQARPMPLE